MLNASEHANWDCFVMISSRKCIYTLELLLWKERDKQQIDYQW